MYYMHAHYKPAKIQNYPSYNSYLKMNESSKCYADRNITFDQCFYKHAACTGDNSLILCRNLHNNMCILIAYTYALC